LITDPICPRPSFLLRTPFQLGTTENPRISNNAIEALAWAGALSAADLLEEKNHHSGEAYCALIHRLYRPSRLVLRPVGFSFDCEKARAGEAIEEGPDTDERVIAWALSQHTPNDAVLTSLIKHCVEYKRQWGLAATLAHLKKPDPTSPAFKTLTAALLNAMAKGDELSISLLVEHGLQHGWDKHVSYVELAERAPNVVAAKVLIQASLKSSDTEKAASHWLNRTTAWHVEIPLRLLQLETNSTYGWEKEKKRKEILQTSGPTLNNWAYHQILPLAKDPAFQPALGWAQASRLIHSDNKAFKAAAQEYARTWKENGWDPNDVFSKPLAALFFTVPLLQPSPGRLVHRTSRLSELLDEHEVGTPAARRHAQAQLWWIEASQMPEVTDAFHVDRFNASTMRLAWESDDTLVAALETFATPDFQRMNNGFDRLSVVRPGHIGVVALNWLFDHYERMDPDMSLRWIHAINGLHTHRHDSFHIYDSKEVEKARANGGSAATGPWVERARLQEWLHSVWTQAKQGQMANNVLLPGLIQMGEHMSWRGMTSTQVIESLNVIWEAPEWNPAPPAATRPLIRPDILALTQAIAALAILPGPETTLDESWVLSCMKDRLRAAQLSAKIPQAPAFKGARPRF